MSGGARPGWQPWRSCAWVNGVSPVLLSLQNQYEFCYKLALSYLDSFKIYGNFK